jgi:hypothetical protein
LAGTNANASASGSPHARFTPTIAAATTASCGAQPRGERVASAAIATALAYQMLATAPGWRDSDSDNQATTAYSTPAHSASASSGAQLDLPSPRAAAASPPKSVIGDSDNGTPDSVVWVSRCRARAATSSERDANLRRAPTAPARAHPRATTAW